MKTPSDLLNTLFTKDNPERLLAESNFCVKTPFMTFIDVYDKGKKLEFKSYPIRQMLLSCSNFSNFDSLLSDEFPKIIFYGARF